MRKRQRAPTFTALVLLLALLQLTYSDVSPGPFIKVEVSERQRQGTVLYSFPESSGAHYSLTSDGDPASLDLFEVTIDGKVKIKGDLLFSPQSSNTHVLTVVERSLGRSNGGVAHVLWINVLDINDNRPLFRKSVYKGHVNEEEPPRTPVRGIEDLVVVDEDTVGSVKFVFIAGNQLDYFSLDTVMVSAGVYKAVVKTKIPFDRELYGTVGLIELKIAADDGSGPITAAPTCELFVEILDVNDNSPVITPVSVSYILDSVPVLNSVLTVEARDADSGLNGEVYFHLVKPNEFFDIDLVTGSVFVSRPLIASQNASKLMVQVTDRGTPERRYALAVFSILIVESGEQQSQVADTNPAFKPESFRISLSDDLPAGAVVLSPRKLLQPQFVGSQLTFDIKDDSGGLLNVTSTGVVRLGRPFATSNSALPPKRNFVLTIVARPPKGRTATTLVQLTFTQSFTNYRSPEFPVGHVYLEFMSGRPSVGPALFVVGARDDDEGPDGSLTYNIVDGSGMNLFTVDEDTGNLTTVGRFHQPNKLFDLIVEARDGGAVTRAGQMYVVLRCQPKFDSVQPHFRQSSYEVAIDENENANSYVVRVSAVLPFSAERPTYAMVTRTNAFSINIYTGLIVSLKPFDYEVERTFWLNVSASFGIKVAYAMVVVSISDQNDNQPRFPFTSRQISVPEGFGSISELACLYALDYDSERYPLTYSIVSGNDAQQFSLNSNTGALSVNNLLYSTKSSHTLVIQASDGSSSTEASITVDVLPMASTTYFGQDEYRTTVNKPQPGDIVATLPVMGSNRNFTCDIGDDTSKTVFSLFSVEASGGSCTVKLRASAKIQPIVQDLSVPIIVFSNRSPLRKVQAMVRVRLDNLQNLPPVFQQSVYMFNLFGPVLAGSVVGRVAAVDPCQRNNTAFTFSVTKTSGTGSFQISTSGDIMSLESIEESSTVELNVFATTVTADGVSSPPELVQCTVAVHPQYMDASVPVLSVRGSTNVFEQTAQNVPLFSIQVTPSVTGRLVLASNTSLFKLNGNSVTLTQTLDYDVANRHSLVFYYYKAAEDPPLVATLKVDVNVIDAPEFSRDEPVLTAYIPVNSTRGTVVRLLKFEYSGAKVNFRIIDSTYTFSVMEGIYLTVDNSKFLSEPTTIPAAVEITFRTPTMRNEWVTRRTVNVQVVSGVPTGTFAEQRKTLNLLDENPVGRYVNTQFRLVDWSSPFFLLRVEQGDPNRFFCLDGSQLVNQRYIDRDRRPQISSPISISASNGESTLISDIRVVILDDNDNAPVFQNSSSSVIEIPEDFAGGNIGRFVAVDIDQGQNGLVSYTFASWMDAESRAIFSIDPSTGIVSTQHQFGYEVRSEYLLVIIASDYGPDRKSAQVEALVRVKDVNNYTPQFLRSAYRAYIKPSTRFGETVLRVSAWDLDSGSFGDVEYLLEGDDSQLFNISPTIGLITLTQAFTASPKLSYTFSVIAQDNPKWEGPRKSAKASVRVVLELNEAKPQFTSQLYNVSMRQDLPPGQHLVRVHAFSNWPVSYSIVSGNSNSTFSIDSVLGVISLSNKSLSFLSMYSLTVEATDTISMKSRSTVIIATQFINRYPPAFRKSTRERITSVVDRYLALGRSAIDLEAYDPDETGPVSCRFVDGTVAEFFSLRHCQLYVLKPLSMLGRRVEFKVAATDTVGAGQQGQQPLTSVVTVELIVTQFLQTPGSDFVYELEELTFGSVAIPNLPKQYNSSIFSFIPEEDSPTFKIDPVSGKISVQNKLDYETQNRFEMVLQEVNGACVKNCENDYIQRLLYFFVSDINDNQPVFNMTSYVGVVSRNARVGTPVMLLTAHDPDSGPAGHVSFEVLDSNVPFAVNPNTSYIEVVGDIEGIRPWYNFTVRASDHGQPPKSTQQVISIKPERLPPLFDLYLYEFNMKENVFVGSEVGRVRAVSLANQTLTYSSTTIPSTFMVTEDGRIILIDAVDFESGLTHFSFAVVAQEQGRVPQRAEARVVVFVTNVNDNVPKFVQAEFKTAGQIPEDVPIDTSLLRVQARDCDCLQNCECDPGQLKYELQNYTDLFFIDVFGNVKNRAKLDYEKTKRYTIPVVVTDFGEGRTFQDTAVIVIELGNVNDNPPMFMLPQDRVMVDWNTGRKHVVYAAKAYDADGDRVSYMLEEGLGFGIDENTGVISLMYSTQFQSSVNLTVIASDSDPSSKSYMRLEVGVEGGNKARPSFQGLCANNYVREKLKEESNYQMVISAAATDQDYGPGGKIFYSLTFPASSAGDTTPPAFRIDSNTGAISLVSALDREQKSRYLMQVVAIDGGPNRSKAERNLAYCELEINVEDINDNRPLFALNSYDLIIWNETPPGEEILKVFAIDADEGLNAEVTYSFFDASVSFFAINQTSGIISVKSSLEAVSSELSLLVVATDRGTPQQSSQVWLRVVVTRNLPPVIVLDKQVFSIEESAPTGSVITTVNVVNYTPDILFSLLTGNFPTANSRPNFVIDSATGVLKTAQPLNFEAEPTYVIYISAMNSKTRVSTVNYVIVQVIDVNDETPIFPFGSFVGTVPEGQFRSEFVLPLTAVDRELGLNGRVTYSLASGGASNFHIEPFSGRFFGNGSFDRETIDIYNVIAIAKDSAANSLTSTVSISVLVTDENDNEPVLSQPAPLTIREDTPVGTVVGEVYATDADVGENSKVVFYIIDGDSNSMFSTTSVQSSHNNVGKVILNRPLDFESSQGYSLTISASDFKFTVRGLLTVTVTDANDNTPQFDASIYRATIREDSAPGTSVLTVSASDLDTPDVQEPLRFSLTGEDAQFFHISPTGGEISVGFTLAKPGLDREWKPSMTFRVVVTDGKLNGNAEVVIYLEDANDEPPYFPLKNYTLSVKENKPAGTLVGYVAALDRDEKRHGQIAYSISDPSGLFTIDERKGSVTTKALLDRDQVQEYKFRVKAYDPTAPQLFAETDVLVKVDDTNNHNPRFLQTRYSIVLNECSSIGSYVSSLKYDDDDMGVNARHIFRILYKDYSLPLYINSDDAAMTVSKVLDFETTTQYRFSVKLSDRGWPSLDAPEEAVVEINITDCNDVAPVFVNPDRLIRIGEDVSMRSDLAQFTAYDPDTGVGGQMEFDLVDPEAVSPFLLEQISPNVAKLISDFPLDAEEETEYMVKLRVSDKGSPSFSSTLNIQVLVMDVNDNPPHFTSPECGFVKENVGAGQEALIVRVADKDKVDANRQIQIYFNDSSAYDMFSLEFPYKTSNQARIVSKKMFDRESQPVFPLVLAAKDSSTPPRIGYQTVYIEVLDDDDNSPTSGGSLLLILNTNKGDFAGGNIGQLYVIDDDQSSASQYRHEVVSSSLYLSLDPDTGVITALPNITAGIHHMVVNSFEKNKSDPSQVTSSVEVSVDVHPEDTISNSVTLRFSGLLKKSRCNELVYVNIQQYVAELLGVPQGYVIVLSFSRVPDSPREVDVRFAVRRPSPGYSTPSEFFSPIDLISALATKKDQLERRSGGKVSAIGPNACEAEPCQAGFCVSQVVVNPGFSTVTEDTDTVPPPAKAMGFVSLNTADKAVCHTAPPQPKSCMQNPCLYSGNCYDIYPSGFYCDCGEGLFGPRCEHVTRHIYLKGSLWLNPLSSPRDGYISFEFRTHMDNALLLYQGPINGDDYTKDFLSVELVNGHLRLMAHLGDQRVDASRHPRVLTLLMSNTEPLNDEVFHTVTVYKQGKRFTMTLDNCANSTIIDVSGKPPKTNREGCEVSGVVFGKRFFLDSKYPLQLGAVNTPEFYPPLISKEFDGCIRRLVDNGVVYDMASPIRENRTFLGCLSVECPYCEHGLCDQTRKPYTCSCYSGWEGANCDEKTPSMYFGDQSFTQTTYSGARKRSLGRGRSLYFTQYKVQVRMTTDGYLLYESSEDQSEYSILMVNSSVLEYIYNVGDREMVLQVPHLNVTNNTWYNVTVTRSGNQATMEVERIARVTGQIGVNKVLDVGFHLYSGGVPEDVLSVRSPATRLRRAAARRVVGDLQGCMGDVRIQDPSSRSGLPVATVTRVNVQNGCPCTITCLNGGVCVDSSPPVCICPEDFMGPFCESSIYQALSSGRAGVSIGVLVLVSLSSVFFITAVLTALMYARRQSSALNVEDDFCDNIMPYHDEGAGEDDFLNYDLNTLLRHAKTKTRGDVDRQPLLARSDVGPDVMVSEYEEGTGLDQSLQTAGAGMISGQTAEVHLFPRDTLLHYAYEGEGSIADNLSELGWDDEDAARYREPDYTFVLQWTTKCEELEDLFRSLGSPDADQ